ncbi:MAG: chromosome partitioning protein ParB [Myxococcales bacterium]
MPAAISRESDKNGKDRDKKATPKPGGRKPGARKPSGTPRQRRGVKLKPTQLRSTELGFSADAAPVPPELATLATEIAEDGGRVLCAYREPLGGHVLLFSALPVEKVVPTPFQRDLSDAHVRRLTVAMDKTRRFLDPIIAVREPKAAAAIEPEARFWTPNGYHRLTALKELGARSVLALVVPERDVAYQILALNIEKAHNLRERAIGVRRMYRDLAQIHDGDQDERGHGHGRTKEESYALEFEEPALVTLGFAYEKRPRLAGGAYHGILRRLDGWVPQPLHKAAVERERRADLLLAFDDAVNEAVARLKERGLTSPYLKAFVVARVNPLRFMKGTLPELDELLATMTRRARNMNVEKIRPADVVRTGGPPEATE